MVLLMRKMMTKKSFVTYFSYVCYYFKNSFEMRMKKKWMFRPCCMVAVLSLTCYGLFMCNTNTHDMRIHRGTFFRQRNVQWSISDYKYLKAISMKCNGIGVYCRYCYWSWFLASLYKNSILFIICVQHSDCWQMSSWFFTISFCTSNDGNYDNNHSFWCLFTPHMTIIDRSLMMARTLVHEI